MRYKAPYMPYNGTPRSAGRITLAVGGVILGAFLGHSSACGHWVIENEPRSKTMNSSREVKWLGGHVCDICGHDCGEHLIDGRTHFGPWAVMCEDCASMHGVGLGLGKGQLYHKTPAGDYVKIAG